MKIYSRRNYPYTIGIDKSYNLYSYIHRITHQLKCLEGKGKNYVVQIGFWTSCTQIAIQLICAKHAFPGIYISEDPSLLLYGDLNT